MSLKFNDALGNDLCVAIEAAGGDSDTIFARLLDTRSRQGIEEIARLLVAQSVDDPSGRFTLWFDRGPGVIARLIAEGGYEDCNRLITDDRYPVTGMGIKSVRFRLFPGETIPHDDSDSLSRAEVEEYFRREQVRFPDAAEALLPPAKNRLLGRDDYSRYVAIIGGSSDTIVIGENSDSDRCLELYTDDIYSWSPRDVFVGVQWHTATK